jgi:hypothetical protein
MKNNYSFYIRQWLETYPANAPFFTDELADNLAKHFNLGVSQAKHIVNTNLNRLTGDLIIRFTKGIYYKPKTTVFGPTKVNPMMIISKMYVYDHGEVIGYETGPSLLQQLGLTTLLPKYRYIATNKFQQKGNRVIEDLGLVIRKPKTTVDHTNYQYLQVLDAVENKEDIFLHNDHLFKTFNDYITKNKLDYGKLIGLARKSYGKEVVLRISDLAASTRI